MSASKRRGIGLADFHSAAPRQSRGQPDIGKLSAIVTIECLTSLYALE